ncbi:GNAT family N-acetyltransferase [Streptomyces fragilis]|uniref:GNAT family N-acetyltransferase n=1 Tax=Streptomyces fragilis TaxID=67301 RepID=A0ABV2YMR1_9ACTN|nr:GNAT family N-acetyltransferase [Streptomyces fragilis]
MTVSVRALRPGNRSDAEAFARIRMLALPYVFFTADSVEHLTARLHPDAHFTALLAEDDGEAIGTAQLSLAHESPEPGQALLNVHVRPDRTGRGAGTALVQAGEELLAGLGAHKVFSWVLDEPADRVFAERRGYRPGSTAQFLLLDLAKAELPPVPAPPPGVELRTAADFADDPRPLFELDAECTADEPGDVDHRLGDYGAWLEETWRHPLLRHDLTTVAVADGRPVAFTAVRTDGGVRYGTGMTGTARAHRGRGLAKLVKADSLHRARAAGFTEAHTGNDAGNEPMLAVNRWLGYRVCAREVQHVRELG